MFLYYFGQATRHSIRAMFSLLQCKNIFTFFSSGNRIFKRKTVSRPLRCVNHNHCCAAEHLYELSRLFSSHQGAKYFLRETLNSPQGTNSRDTDLHSSTLILTEFRLRCFLREANVFPEPNNCSFLEARYFPGEALKAPMRNTHILIAKKALYLSCSDSHASYDKSLDIETCLKAVPGLLKYDSVSFSCDANTNDGSVTNTYDDRLIKPCKRNSQSRKQGVICRVRSRDREPSRVSLRKLMNSLRHKKWRKKCKIWLKKPVPASSVLYRIATNYQQWHVAYAKKQDVFYLSHYFEKAQIFI